MSEVPDAREEHSNPVLVAGGDRILVLDRPAWLNDRGHANLCRFVDIIGKREERVRGEYRTFRSLTGLAGRKVHRIDTAHLSRSDADDLPALRQNDGIALHVLANFPGEVEIGTLGGGRLALR